MGEWPKVHCEGDLVSIEMLNSSAEQFRLPNSSRALAKRKIETSFEKI